MHLETCLLMLYWNNWLFLVNNIILYTKVLVYGIGISHFHLYPVSYTCLVSYISSYHLWCTTRLRYLYTYTNSRKLNKDQNYGKNLSIQADMTELPKKIVEEWMLFSYS